MENILLSDSSEFPVVRDFTEMATPNGSSLVCSMSIAVPSYLDSCLPLIDLY
jgi:hypothetical protein